MGVAALAGMLSIAPRRSRRLAGVADPAVCGRSTAAVGRRVRYRAVAPERRDALSSTMQAISVPWQSKMSEAFLRGMRKHISGVCAFGPAKGEEPWVTVLPHAPMSLASESLKQATGFREKLERCPDLPDHAVRRWGRTWRHGLLRGRPIRGHAGEDRPHTGKRGHHGLPPLALGDDGAPSYDRKQAAAMASRGV